MIAIVAMGGNSEDVDAEAGANEFNIPAQDPSLSNDVVGALRSFVNRSEMVLVSPIPGQDATIVVTA